MQLEEIDLAAVASFDAYLARQKLRPSTRRNVLVVLRSVLRTAVDAEWLAAMPRLKRLPKVGGTIPKVGL